MKANKRKAENKSSEAVATAPAFAWWKPALLLLALVLTFQIYGPALDGPYVFDDQYLPGVEDDHYGEQAITVPLYTSRPLFNLSFWLTHKAVSNPTPHTHHVINIWLHFFNAVLMFFVLRKLVDSQVLAAFAAALFLLHPVQTEAVAYIAGRSESLCLLFFLGSYLLFLHHRKGGIGWAPAMGSLALFGLAVISKEHAAVLPFLMAATDLYLDGVEGVRRNWRLYAPMALLGAAGLTLVWSTLKAADTAGFGMKDLSWDQYFMTQWRAIWVYLRLFVAPVGLNADYDFAISRSITEHGAIFGLLGLLALAGAAFYFRKQSPLIAFGLLVFFLLIAPTSSIVPIRDAVAERRMYMPFLGLLLASIGLLKFWRAPTSTQVPVFALLLAALGWMTYARSAVWGSPLALWEDTTSKSPHNARAHFHRAMALYHEAKCKEAAKSFEAAHKAGNREHRLFVDWALALDCDNRADEALTKLREAIRIQDTGHAHSLVGMILAKQTRYDDALRELDLSLKMDGSQDMAYVYRGNVYFLQQQPAEALRDFQAALQLNPANEAARQGIAAIRAKVAKP